MKGLSLNSPLFFKAYLIFLVLGAFILLGYYRGWEFELIEVYRNQTFDGLFLFLNKLGEPLFVILLSLLLISYRLGNFISIGLAILLNSVLTQALKRIVFGPMPRPSKYLDGIIELQQVGGERMLESFSFPSGHTALAFCMFSISCLLVKNKWWNLLAIILAIGAGFARIYLNQHFFVDAYFGSFVGVFSAVIAWKTSQWLQGRFTADWLNFSLRSKLLGDRAN